MSVCLSVTKNDHTPHSLIERVLRFIERASAARSEKNANFVFGGANGDSPASPRRRTGQWGRSTRENAP
jgi:hypothetical protein